jgi:anti-anti-sigma regulatory factor
VLVADPSIADLDLGDHACVLFDRDEEALAQTAVFTQEGLRRNQRVVICTERLSPEAMSRRMAERVPSFAASVATGQVTVAACDDVQLAGGRFDPRLLTTAFLASADEAVRAGYAGMRVSADMTYGLRDVAGIDALYDFEAAANTFFTTHRIAAICQYDRRRFDRAALDRACAAHPLTPGQAPLRFTATDDPPALTLSGEADATNRDALAAVLATVAAVDDDVTIDAGMLTFADAYAIGLLVEVARRRRGRRTTLVCSPVVGRLLGLLGSGDLTVVRPGPASDV